MAVDGPALRGRLDERRGQRRGQGHGISRWDEPARTEMCDLRDPTHLGRDEWGPACDRLQENVRNALGPARQHGDVRRTIPVCELPVWSGTLEMDDGLKPQPLYLLLQVLSLRPGADQVAREPLPRCA